MTGEELEQIYNEAYKAVYWTDMPGVSITTVQQDATTSEQTILKYTMRISGTYIRYRTAVWQASTLRPVIP